MFVLYILLGVLLTCACLYGLVAAVFKHFQVEILDFMMKKMHTEMQHVKRELFETASKQVASKPKHRLEVLEIGVGTGENFKYYPINSNVTILDKTNAFSEYYKDSILKASRPDLQISSLVVNNAENMHSIESNSYDLVVHTFLLCSVEDTRKVLSEISRVLKPDGVCVFVEHARDSENRMRRLVQRVLQPLFGGCRYLNIENLIRSGSFYSRLVIKRFYFQRSLVLYTESPVIYGYGKK
jgi:ubiquinone/menaquinone biosynthesis C-methylase UbiE